MSSRFIPSGKGRRTLKFIDRYRTPRQLIDRINKDGWHYVTRKEFYKKRDSALCAILYVCALRVSEALRIKRDQCEIMSGRVVIEAIRLSKAHKADKIRRNQFREYAFIPLVGERAELGRMVKDYLELLDGDDKLFCFGSSRAYRIVNATLGVPPHWLRAFGENYLYDNWEKDLLAVADYVKVDPRTLAHYIRRSYTKYKEV